MSLKRALKRRQEREGASPTASATTAVKVVRSDAPIHTIPDYIIQNDTLNQRQLDILKGKNIAICTPMYGGMCSGQFTHTITKFQIYADRIGMQTSNQYLFNESLVQRGRNALTYMALANGADYLMWIDADIGFNPMNIFEMILACEMTGEKLLGATYSKKEINWAAVARGVQDGVHVDHLKHISASHVIIPKGQGSVEMQYYGLFPVQYLGTGFMLMHKSVLKAIAPQCKTYRNNHIPNVPNTEKVTAYFDCEIVNDIYLSEDYLFCHRAEVAGIEAKLCPWVPLDHFGTYPFQGCYMCTQGGYVHSVKKETPK